MSAEHPNTNSALRRTAGYLKPQLFFLVLAIIGFTLYALTQPMSAVLIEWLIKTLDGELENGIYLIPAAFVGVSIARGIGTYMGGYYIAKVTQRMVEAIRVDLFENLIQLPISVYDKNKSGKLISLFTFNTTTMARSTAASITTLVQEGLTVVALLIYLFYTNWQFTAAFILLAPPIGLLINKVGKLIKSLGQEMQESMAELNNTVSEELKAIRLIKESVTEQYSARRLREDAKLARKLGLQIAKVNSIYTPSMQILIACAMAVIVVFVILEKGDMETAELIAYVTAAALLSKPVRNLSNVHIQLTQASVAAEEVFSYVDAEKEEHQGGVAHKIKGHIEYRNVSFRYGSDDDKILDNVQFEVPAGTTTALVGRSGGGKSTIANLLPRFYDLESGQIFIDDIDVNDFSLVSLRRQISVVSQQVFLFNTSIRDNIAYGCETATEVEIENAAKQAHAHDFIADLSEGYQTLIGDNGVMLSGGQRQRIAIARAILRDAPILILDEATSALDNESELKVQRALERIMQNRTTLVIAHRLSTIENADNIIVLQSGKIVEAGDHTTLRASNGLYAKMLNKDFS